MKNKLIFIVIIAFSLSAKAQIYGTIQGTSVNDNIGIGTQNPVAKLTIQAGSEGYPTPLRAISIWGPNSPENANSARDLSWDFASAGSASIRSYRGSGYDTYMQFMTNNANVSSVGNKPEVRMHINGNGNIGIGTTNPLAKLAIYDGNILVKNIDNVNNFSSRMIAHSVKDADFTEVGTSIATIVQNAGGNAYGMQFFTMESHLTGQTEKLRISGNGNVGIGTINPLNKLDVNGTIHSREVKVDMTGWSDFVFKKDYDLPTLEEVEKHIAERGHLENIPSEEEVLKNGINLGEMNAKLLQKIEELTLYMIEMRRENEIVKNENNLMKKNQIELEKRIKNIEKKQ